MPRYSFRRPKYSRKVRRWGNFSERPYFHGWAYRPRTLRFVTRNNRWSTVLPPLTAAAFRGDVGRSYIMRDVNRMPQGVRDHIKEYGGIKPLRDEL